MVWIIPCIAASLGVVSLDLDLAGPLLSSSILSNEIGIQSIDISIGTSAEHAVLHQEIGGTVVQMGHARVMLQTGAAVVGGGP